MSSPDPKTVLSAYHDWLAGHPGGHAEMSRLLRDKPSDEALRQFAEGETERPRFLGRLMRAIEGRPDVPDLVEEAETALRLVREAEAAMLRVTERLRQLPPDADTARSIAAADKPMPTAQPDARPATRRRGAAEK